jgi:hypothetical protein
MSTERKGLDMTQMINNHKITLTIGTAVICTIAVFTFAFSLGAEQKEIKTTALRTEVKIDKHIEEEERQKKEDQARQRRVDNAIISMQKDIEYIKESMDEKK